MKPIIIIAFCCLNILFGTVGVCQNEDDIDNKKFEGVVLKGEPLIVDTTNLPIDFISARVGFNGKFMGTIDKAVMLNTGQLLFIEKKDSMLSITSFTMTFVTYNKNPMEYSNKENGRLTIDMINELKLAPSGAKVYFEYINCIDALGNKKKLLASYFVIQ